MLSSADIVGRFANHNEPNRAILRRRLAKYKKKR